MRASQRNRAPICSFFVKGECKRGAECPYRHEMPTTGELANQNIKDRYFGVNDPVARKMMGRVSNMPKLEPPEDTTITTLFVGMFSRHKHRSLAYPEMSQQLLGVWLWGVLQLSGLQCHCRLQECQEKKQVQLLLESEALRLSSVPD